MVVEKSTQIAWSRNFCPQMNFEKFLESKCQKNAFYCILMGYSAAGKQDLPSPHLPRGQKLETWCRISATALHLALAEHQWKGPQSTCYVKYYTFLETTFFTGEYGMDLRSKKIAKIGCLLGFICQSLATNSEHFLFYLVQLQTAWSIVVTQELYLVDSANPNSSNNPILGIRPRRD